MAQIKDYVDSPKSLLSEGIPKEFIPEVNGDYYSKGVDELEYKDSSFIYEKDKESSNLSVKDESNKRSDDRKLIWPYTCWICRNAVTKKGTFIVCSGLCKRVYHKKCHNYMKVQFDHIYDKYTANEDVKISSVLNISHSIYEPCKLDKLVKEMKTNKKSTSLEHNFSTKNNYDMKFNVDVIKMQPSKNANHCEEMTDKDTSHKSCFFCAISYVGCNGCRQFDEVNRMVKCSVSGCTTFYCYPSCITKSRIIIPDKRVIDMHKSVFGHLKHLMDTNGKPIFICHSHTCWSCYDCDRYSYYWENFWRSELSKAKNDDLINAWNSLKMSCRGKVESTYFLKGKKIVRPQRYPELKGYKCFYQSKNSIINSLQNEENLYDVSDDEHEQLQKGPSNILLKCIRCDRTWCTQCIHPDVHIVPNSGKQIICHDCIHIQVACTLTRYSKDPDNRSNMMKKECMMPTIKIDSSYPNEIYTQLKNFVTEHATYEKKLSLGPTFISKPPIEGFDSEYHLINIHKTLTITKKNEKPPPKKGEGRQKQSTKPTTHSKNSQHTFDISISNEYDIPRVNTNKKDHNSKSKEWNDIIKGCDADMISNVSSKFRYITSNILTSDTRKLITAPDTNASCTCQTGCYSDCSNVIKNVECTNKICSLGDRNCGNRRFSNFVSPKLRLDIVEGKGIGAFATEDIQASELVCEYVGEVISQTEFQRSLNSWSFAEMDNDNQCHWYIMKIHKDMYIDSTHLGNVARFINHSCDPNCSSIPINVRGIYRMGVFALKKINKGEEVSYNYGFTSKGVGKGFKCHCNSKNCRGIIGVQPVNPSESLAYIESVKNEGDEVDVLKQLCSDMSSTNTVNLLQNLKQQPSPLDILNGMWTCGDLHRFEKLMSKTSCSNEGKNDVIKQSNRNINLPNPIYSFLSDTNHVSNVQFNYIKVLALNGLSIKEFDLANTKQFFNNAPWGVIALGHSEISQKMAMECSATFDEFYTLAKRFIQNSSMALSRYMSGMNASENIQGLLDLTWGATEACTACGGYGDCKCCDFCGDILHDNNNCGDFYVDKFGTNLCSFCQNSNHRNNWYIAHYMERERIAMDLWTIRMKEMVKRQLNVLKIVCSGQRDVIKDDSCGHDITSNELYKSLFIDGRRLFCSIRDFKLFNKDPYLFYECQHDKLSLCDESIGQFECFF